MSDPTIEASMQQIVFSFAEDTEAGVPAFRDAVYVAEGTPQADIDALILQRYNAFREQVLNPAPEEPAAPTDALAAAIDAVTQAQAAIAGAQQALCDAAAQE